MDQPNIWRIENFLLRAIYSNLDNFQYTYGSGKFNIILKPPPYLSFVTYDAVYY